MTKPFRFGVQISQTRRRPTAWRDKARKLEDLGYSTLFMPDHFGDELAPMPAIAMAAAHTTTLRIGALVFDNDYKHPAILAKEAATIDLLCDGRLELGIGAGWMKTDYDALGLAYDPPAVRVDRFEEALHVIKQCFTGEKFSYHGRALPHHRLRVVPEAGAGAGPADPRSAAAASACCRSRRARPTSSASTRTSAPARSALDAARATRCRSRPTARSSGCATRPGARFDDIEIQMRFFVCNVTDDRMGLANALAPGFGVEPEEALESGAALVGSETEIIEQLHRRRERGACPTSSSATRTSTSSRRSSPSSPAPSRATQSRRAGNPLRAALAELARRPRRAVAGAREQHDLAVAGEHLHDLARLRRQDLVGGAVERAAGECRPARSASSQPADCVERVTTPRQCVPSTAPVWIATAPPNEWPDHHEPARAAPAGEIGRRGDVVHAAAEIVRLAVADADRADAACRERARRGRGRGRRPARAGCPSRRRT